VGGDLLPDEGSRRHVTGPHTFGDRRHLPVELSQHRAVVIFVERARELLRAAFESAVILVRWFVLLRLGIGLGFGRGFGRGFRLRVLLLTIALTGRCLYGSLRRPRLLLLRRFDRSCLDAREVAVLVFGQRDRNRRRRRGLAFLPGACG